jgi:ABC-type polysaccharide/polyol phosphate export permease
MATNYLKTLHYTLELSFQLAKAEFKLRNEGSYLGILWYILNPVLTFTLLFLIFSDRLGGEIPHYAPYLLLGILIFNFFQSSTIESAKSLTRDNHHLIKSIHFPKEALVLSIIIKNLISHCIEILIFFGVLVFLHLELLPILYYIPLLFFISLFTLGVSFFLATLSVFFADMDNIWSFMVRLLWFGTPIFYSIADQIRLFYLNLFNPLYYFIATARDLILYQDTPATWLMVGVVGWGLASFIIGLLIFKLSNKKIAELL